jgi:integration host factor subunit beta
MKKIDIINNLVNEYGIPKAQAKTSVDLILKTLIDAIDAKDRIEIRGFGSFCSRYRKPRLGINPRNTKPINIKGRFTVFFKPSKNLKELVNNNIK